MKTNNNHKLVDVFYEQVKDDIILITRLFILLNEYTLPGLLKIIDPYNPLWKEICTQHMEIVIEKRFAADVCNGKFPRLRLVDERNGSYYYRFYREL